MSRKHSNNSRIIKRTLVIIPSAALLVGFTLAQTLPPQPVAKSRAKRTNNDEHGSFYSIDNSASCRFATATQERIASRQARPLPL